MIQPRTMNDRAIEDSIQALRRLCRKELNYSARYGLADQYASEKDVDQWVGIMFPDYGALIAEKALRSNRGPSQTGEEKKK